MNRFWRWGMIPAMGLLCLSLGLSAQQSAWTTQILAEGPDSSGKRLLDPDLDVDSLYDNDPANDHVYVTYIDQDADIVWLLISKNGRAGPFEKIEVANPGTPVKSSSVAVDTFPTLDSDGKIVPGTAEFAIVCVNWQQIGDAGSEVYVRCAKVTAKGVEWLSDPVRLSGEGLIGGQHELGGGEWSGGEDCWISSFPTLRKFRIYCVWGEDLQTLKVAVSTDGVTFTPAGELPNQSGSDLRYPTIYEFPCDPSDRENPICPVYVSTAQAIDPSDILVWDSLDGGQTWRGPVNVTSNGGFSDAPGIVRVGNKVYGVNDETTTNPNNADINFWNCDVTNAGLANCQGTRAIYKDGAFPQIDYDADDNTLHVTAENIGDSGLVVYCYSQDGGATWVGDPIPNSKPNTVGVRDADFGINVSRNRIRVDTPAVYIVWMTRQEGRSRIMLSSRTTPPSGEPAATCAP